MVSVAPFIKSLRSFWKPRPTVGSTGIMWTPTAANAARSTLSGKFFAKECMQMPETKTDPYQLSRWSLDDLFPGHESKEMKAALKKLDTLISSFEKQRKKLKKTITKKDFLAILDQLEAQT